MKPNMNILYAGLLFNSLGSFFRYFLNFPDFICFLCLGAGCGLIIFSLFTTNEFIKAAAEKKKRFLQSFHIDN